MGTEALVVDPAIGHAVGLGLSNSSDGGSDDVSTFETRSGRMIRTVTVTSGVVLGALAVDEQTARLFVAYDLSNTVSVLDATHL